jgi:hypothetical protein
MQIMSRKSRFKWLAVVTACLSNLVCAQVYSSEAITFNVDNGSSLTLDVRKPKVAVALHGDSKDTTLKVSKDLRKLLVAADDVVQLNGVVYADAGQRIFFLVARLPSKTNNTMGYCGAGHEDYLLLIELHPTQLVLDDKLLVQSCLTSLDFLSDKGDDVKFALKTSSTKPEIRTKWMNHPTFDSEEKSIVAQDGRLVIRTNDVGNK